MGRAPDPADHLAGRRIGAIRVIERVGTDTDGDRLWLCTMVDCEEIVRESDLTELMNEND